MKMLGVLTLLALLWPPSLGAKVYFVNKGVKYHIGDNRFDKSEDATFIDTYPVVGEEWIQAFKVNEGDHVKVSIGNIWGVDDCAYCKILVSIGDWDMGRITQANNHEPFNTLQPLACPVEPGKTYFLKIASYALGGSSDDFVFSDVVVETEHASIEFMQPGPIIKMPDQPMPEIFNEPSRPPSRCDNLAVNHNWLLGWNAGKAAPTSLQPADDFADSGPLDNLEPGQSLDMSFQAGNQDMIADRVDYAFEIMAGQAPASGWIFQFHDRVRGLYHGNLKLKGNYSSRSFSAPSLDKAGLNKLRLEYCTDGTLHLMVNGHDLGQSLSGMKGTLPISARALGVSVTVQGE